MPMKKLLTLSRTRALPLLVSYSGYVSIGLKGIFQRTDGGTLSLMVTVV